jgi:hypothetical protein
MEIEVFPKDLSGFGGPQLKLRKMIWEGKKHLGCFRIRPSEGKSLIQKMSHPMEKVPSNE